MDQDTFRRRWLSCHSFYVTWPYLYDH